MSKPCEAPCPKCGSLDILRRFYKRSEKIETRDFGKPPLPRWVGGSGYTWWASRDLISHHCRCCQHDWVDGPLPKQGGKKQTETSAIPPSPPPKISGISTRHDYNCPCWDCTRSQFGI